MKVGLIAMHPAPYRDDTFKAFAEKSRINLEVLNVECDAWNHKEWNFTPWEGNEYLGKTVKLPFLGVYNKGLITFLRKKKYDVLAICGYYPTSMLTTLIFAWCSKTPYILCCDTVNISQRARLLAKVIYKKAAAFWTTGKCAKKYLLSNGISSDDIFEGYYTNDAYGLLEQIQDYKCECQAIKANLGIRQEDKVFLFVGKLIPSRQIEILLEAISLLSGKKYNFKIIIIGDGEDSNKVEEYVKKYSSIIHIKQVEYNDMQKYYSISDSYIHPGQEPYSLAVVEAAIAGLAIVATDKVGSTHDILADGKNGYLFDGTSANLALCMERILCNEISHDELKNMQQYILNNRNIDWAADEFEKAINRCCKKK